MKTHRRTAVLATAGVLLALGTAARAADAVRYHTLPYPFPNPRCGDYIDDCPKPLPSDDCPGGDQDICHPMIPRHGGALENLKGGMSGVAGALRDNDFSKAGAALDGLFTGTNAGSGDASVVMAGNPPPSPDEGVAGPKVDAPKGVRFRVAGWDAAPVPLPARGVGRGQPRFRTVQEEGVGLERPRDLIEEQGQAVQDRLIGEAIDKINDRINRYVDRDQTRESIEKYGGCRMKGTCDR